MENLKKILFATIDYHTKGVDTYHNNGSMWLIFTDKKKWVIELTKEGTLWYNHYFFNNCFKYLSLDAIENQHYITEWVEDIIQNGVRSTLKYRYPTPKTLESIIQNGVKDTGRRGLPPPPLVESIIQNGVIDTFGVDVDLNHLVENTIRNGVKETDFHVGNLLYDVEDTIQNGVKHTEAGGYLGSIEMKGKIVHQFESPKQNNEVEDIIQNGVKRTVSYKDRPEPTVEVVIQSGIKETNPNHLMGDLTIEEVIQNGVKETKKLEHDRTTYHGYFSQERGSHTPLDTVQDVIENGIKKTNWRTVDNFPEFEERVIQNGIKETWGYERQPQTRVNDVIQTGQKI